jgi:trimeric autotransporter adhesin
MAIPGARARACTRARPWRLAVMIGATALLAACGGRTVAARAAEARCGPLGCDDAGEPIMPPDGSAGDEWTVVSSEAPRDLRGVWGSSASDVWAVGDDGWVLRWDGVRWTAVETRISMSLYGVWGSAADDVWVVGRDEELETGVVARWNGTAWSTQHSDTFAAVAVWGTSPTNVWIAGPTTFLHWDGVVWTLPAAFLSGFSAIWGSDQYRVWFVNEVGGFLYLPTKTGGQTGVASLAGVWGSRASDPGGDGDVWGVGADGAITHYGYHGIWTPYASGTKASLAGVWGSGANDVWAVGAGGTLLHWDGAAWSATRSGATRDLNAIWGSGPHDVWIVGAGGTILHRGR